MAKGYEAPAGVDIAALKKKQTNVALDLMRPGDGTPWEDRGAQGTVKAFFQTCVHSITRPALLLDHIRRPDTPGEASQFAYGCSAFWAISAAIHMVIYHIVYPPDPMLVRYLERNDQSYDQGYYIKTAILSVIAGAAAHLVLVQFAKRMYFAMVSTELKNNAPRVLVHNLFCYAMGPSILAPIPLIGPVAALVLIFIAWCVAGAKRLYISWRGSVVAAVLTFAVSLIIAGGAMFVLNLVVGGAVIPRLTDEELEQMQEAEGILRESQGK